MGYRERIFGNYVTARNETTQVSLDGFRPRAPYMKKLIRECFPKNRDAKIMDLGCGDGVLLHFARLAGYSNVAGVDASVEQVHLARGLGIDVSQGDLMPTLAGLSNGSQDVVVAFDVIEHLRKDEIVAFVDQALRVLRPGGVFIIHTVNGESPFFGGSRYGDFTHELAFTRMSMKQLLLASGFASLTCHEDQPIPRGPKSVVRWVLWKMIRGALRLWTAAETGDLARNAIFSRNFLTVAKR